MEINWIPVSEKLPEEFCYCLVTVSDGSKRIVSPVVYIPDEEAFFYLEDHHIFPDVDPIGEGGYSEIKVVAWMELPEAYKEPEKQLFYEPITGRYFSSTHDDVMRAINLLDESLLVTDGAVSVNDVYRTFGLETIDLGNCLIWHNNLISPMNCFIPRLSPEFGSYSEINYESQPKLIKEDV